MSIQLGLFGVKIRQKDLWWIVKLLLVQDNIRLIIIHWGLIRRQISVQATLDQLLWEHTLILSFIAQIMKKHLKKGQINNSKLKILHLGNMRIMYLLLPQVKSLFHFNSLALPYKDFLNSKFHLMLNQRKMLFTT